jgi:hypothetical protein
VKVVDPAGEGWRVKRRWLPWRLRRRDPEDFIDLPVDGGVGDDLLVGLAIFVGLIVILVVVPFVAVLAILVGEMLLLLLLLPLFVALRATFVARWPIEVWRGDTLVHAEAVRGWGSSERRMREIEDGIGRGDPPRPARRHAADGPAD